MAFRGFHAILIRERSNERTGFSKLWRRVLMTDVSTERLS
jgi:hypothetical protein